jgi:hypothetical protein
MAGPEQPRSSGKPGPPPLLGQDRVVGIVILVVGALLFHQTFSFRTVDWDPLGLPFWPRIVLGLMAVTAVYLILRNRLDAGPFQRLQGRAFALLGGLSLYVLLLPWLGYLVATPLMLFCFHLALGGVRPARLLEAAVFAAVATWLVALVFEGWLFVQFPEGLMAPPP